MITTAIRATMRPYSTAVAPRSPFRRTWSFDASLVIEMRSSNVWVSARRRAGLWPPPPPPRSRSGVHVPPARGCTSDLGGDVVEGRRQVVPEKGDGRDDHDGDEGDHEAVLDGGRALLAV